MSTNRAQLREQLRQLADPATAQSRQRFFKMGPGEYGEGDCFLGIRVPALRKLARDEHPLPLDTIVELLRSAYHEERFLRPGLLRADALAPSASTYAKHFQSLDAAYQRVFHAAIDGVAEQVENLLRGQVHQIERYADFLVINRQFTVLIQPSVPVTHGYRQYWYFRPDLRAMIDITLGVPMSGPDGPQILGYLALPRLLVRDRGIRLFGSSETRLDMYGHAGLELITQLARP